MDMVSDIVMVSMLADDAEVYSGGKDGRHGW